MNLLHHFYVQEEFNSILTEDHLSYALAGGGSLCCKSRYKKCKEIVSKFSKELEFTQGT